MPVDRLQEAPDPAGVAAVIAAVGTGLAAIIGALAGWRKFGGGGGSSGNGKKLPPSDQVFDKALRLLDEQRKEIDRLHARNQRLEEQHDADEDENRRLRRGEPTAK